MEKMLEIELCRICLADSIRMYPIQHTRYSEIFEWYTQDTMDKSDDLPYSVCYLCNAVLNRLYDFLKQMIDTEIYLKELLRNTSELTYERVEQLKREMISKPHNLSKVWLRNSNFIALDAFKGQRPPRELRKYFNNPPIMIEYHKPYEHMKLEDIPEEQELEEINKEPKETKQAETEEKMEVDMTQIKEGESETIKEAETESVIEVEAEELKEAGNKKLKEAGNEDSKEAGIEEKMDVESDQIQDKDQERSKLPAPELISHCTHIESAEHNVQKPLENEDLQNPPEKELENQPTQAVNYSEITAGIFEFGNDDENTSIEEEMTLVWSPEIENNSPDTTNIENFDEPIINNSNNQSESISSNKSNKIPDSIDSFLLCAKQYRPPKQTSNEILTKKDHSLELLEKNIEIEKDTQEKQIKIPDSRKFHNQYLQFIEERIPTENEPPKNSSNTSEHRVHTTHPKKYQNQNYKKIDRNTPLLQQTSKRELTAEQLEKKYFNLYEPVKEKPFIISNELIVYNIMKPTPVGSVPNKPNLKLMKPTNDPAKIIVTSGPKKYIHSYVHCGKDINIKENVNEAIPLKKTRKRKTNIKKNTKKTIVPITPVQENLSEDNVQKMYHRASILRKTHLSNKNKREIQELTKRIQNRAATLRNRSLNFQKTDYKAENGLEKKAVTESAPNNETHSPGIYKSQPEITPTHLAIQSKEQSDKLLKLSQGINNRKLWHVVEYPGKSNQTDRVPADEPKDKNQGIQYNAVIDKEGQNDFTISKDQEDTNDLMWSDQDDSTMDSQVNKALKVLDESLEDEYIDSLPNEGDQDHKTNGQSNQTQDTNDALQLEDAYIVIDDDLDDNNEPTHQDDPSLVVQNVFTLNDQVSKGDLITKEQYDQIVMLANQDDQVMADNDVSVKIESVDEESQGTFEENNEEENLVSDTETFDNEDKMHPNNDGNDIVQHEDIKFEVEQNMQIDDDVSEYEPNLQETANLNENTTPGEQCGPSSYENPDFESHYNIIDVLKEQEHYAIRSISEIPLMPTVHLERLPIKLIKRNHKKDNDNEDDNDHVYTCTLCDFKTTVRKLIFRHKNIHDMNKQFVCNVCQHRFLSYYHLSRHKVIHDSANYFCAFCSFKTTVKSAMDQHKKVQHKLLLRFSCTKCQKRFRSPRDKARHSCKNPYLHKCKVCSRSFKNEANYLRHLDKHARVFKCSVCFISFDNRRRYLAHCKQCNTVNGRKDSHNLKYKCNWCNRGFRFKSNCKKHMKLHEKYLVPDDTGVELDESDTTKVENFVCGLCQKSFDTEIELGKHAVDHIL